MTVDKLALYDNVKGVFADLDDGGLTDDEALDQIRKLIDARKPLPDKVVLMGTLPFTITVDTRTHEVDEFEINYDFPNFERKAETRISGDEVDINEDQLTELIDAVDNLTVNWPDPERM
jgi:hypothetical protein